MDPAPNQSSEFCEEELLGADGYLAHEQLALNSNGLQAEYDLEGNDSKFGILDQGLVYDYTAIPIGTSTTCGALLQHKLSSDSSPEPQQPLADFVLNGGDTKPLQAPTELNTTVTTSESFPFGFSDFTNPSFGGEEMTGEGYTNGQPPTMPPDWFNAFVPCQTEQQPILPSLEAEDLKMPLYNQLQLPPFDTLEPPYPSNFVTRNYIVPSEVYQQYPPPSQRAPIVRPPENPLDHAPLPPRLRPAPLPQGLRPARRYREDRMSHRSPGEGPFFSQTKTQGRILDQKNNELKVQLVAKITKGFLTDDDGHTWHCYRRNYFSAHVYFKFEPPLTGGSVYLENDNESEPHHLITGWSATITGRTYDPGRIGDPRDLVQHTAKRDRGSQKRPPRQELIPTYTGSGSILSTLPYHSYASQSALPPGSYGVDSRYVATKHPAPASFTWDRIQFSKATANNGKRRAQQQFYSVNIDLHADISKGARHQWVKIAAAQSVPVVVRGRSPGHYKDMNVKSATSPGSGSSDEEEKSPKREGGLPSYRELTSKMPEYPVERPRGGYYTNRSYRGSTRRYATDSETDGIFTPQTSLESASTSASPISNLSNNNYGTLIPPIRPATYTSFPTLSENGQDSLDQYSPYRITTGRSADVPISALTLTPAVSPQQSTHTVPWSDLLWNQEPQDNMSSTGERRPPSIRGLMRPSGAEH